jgi:putative transposase
MLKTCRHEYHYSEEDMLPSEILRRRNLPHWDVPGAAYFVTTCLEVSIPTRGLVDIDGYRSHLQHRERPRNRSEQEWALDCSKLLFARTDQWLDHEPAVRHLSDPRLAKIVVDATYFFAGERYDLLSYVVMPSHIHWVFQPREDWLRTLGDDDERTPRERIVHGLNRHTALECNQIRSQTGRFWQHESYDHWVRDYEELERIALYIEANPVKAGLAAGPEQWAFSSAMARKEAGLEAGQALPKRVIKR